MHTVIRNDADGSKQLLESRRFGNAATQFARATALVPPQGMDYVCHSLLIFYISEELWGDTSVSFYIASHGSGWIWEGITSMCAGCVSARTSPVHGFHYI